MSKILTITGDINIDTYKKVLEFIGQQRRIDINNKKKIIIVINSFGGNIDAGFAIYDLLSMCKFDITTIALGCCASIATILFSLGNERYVTPNSTIVVHSAGYRVESTKITPVEAMEKFNELNLENEKIMKCYLDSNNFKMSKGELEVMFNSLKDYKFSAMEAAQKGFATDIITDISQIM